MVLKNKCIYCGFIRLYIVVNCKYLECRDIFRKVFKLFLNYELFVFMK